MLAAPVRSVGLRCVPPYGRALVHKVIFVFSRVRGPFGGRFAAAARPLCGRKTGAKRARSGPKRSPGAAGWGTPQRPGTGASGARPWAMRGWSNAQACLHPVSVLAWPQHAAACITMDLVAGGQERASTVAGAGICAGAGTNEPDMDVWKVYSANGTHGPAPSAPHQQVMSSESNTAERSLHAVVGTIVN